MAEGWQDYLKRMRAEVGGTGLTALNNVRSMGANQSDINNFIRQQGWTVGTAAQQAGYGGGSGGSSRPVSRPAASRPSSTGGGNLPEWQDYLKQMRANVGGTGLTAVETAGRMGASQAEINNFIRQQGWTVGTKAQQAGYGGGASSQTQSTGYDPYQAQAFYQSQLNSISAEYERRFSEMRNEYSRALSSQAASQSALDRTRAEAQEAKKRAAELEKMRDDERELSVSQQLGSLRSGATVAGSAGPGLGSLSSGRSSYSVSTGGKSGGILDRAYKDIDPTDSVLDKDVASAAAASVQSSSSGQRTEARRRALSAGSASSYYAQRFG